MKTGATTGGLALLLAASLFGAAPASANVDPNLEQCFLSLANAEREASSLSALAPRADLTEAARSHSAIMLEAGTIFHSDTDDWPALFTNWASMAENVGMGPTCASLHEAFMNSPTHRANLLGASFDRAGVGVETTASGTIYVTVLFLEQREAPPSPVGDGIALVDPSTAEWHLRLLDGSVQRFTFGHPGDIPIMGDWDCDQLSTPGMYRQSTGFVYLTNKLGTGTADVWFYLGTPGDIPLAGDFDGDGCDTVSVYRPGQGRAYVANLLGFPGSAFVADYSFFFGVPGDKPFVGDFDGDGDDGLGLHRESNGLVYFTDQVLHSQLVAGAATTDTLFVYGIPGDRLVAGDWDDNGTDTVAVFRPMESNLYLRNANNLGYGEPPINFGLTPFLPVAFRVS